jgi:hypothetical protein
MVPGKADSLKLAPFVKDWMNTSPMMTLGRDHLATQHVEDGSVRNNTQRRLCGNVDDCTDARGLGVMPRLHTLLPSAREQRATT